jgi:hypothetical protein
MGDLHRNREEIRAEFGNLIAILRAPTFDPDAFAQSLKAQADTLEKRRDGAIDVYVKRVADMPPERRAVLADQLEKVLRRFRH